MKFTAAGMMALLLFAVGAPGQSAGLPAPGDVVPDFTVTDLAGNVLKRSELHRSAKSKPDAVVLTFWCTFCHSCRGLDRKLEKLAADYQGRAAVFAVDAAAEDTPEKVAAFFEAKGVKLPVVLDHDGKVADLFGVKVTTTTLVIDAKGVLRYRGQFGRGSDAYAEDALKAVLAGEEVAVKSTREFG
jgi:peroxiredoxin